jgi:hypothetical protein
MDDFGRKPNLLFLLEIEKLQTQLKKVMTTIGVTECYNRTPNRPQPIQSTTFRRSFVIS